MKKTLLFLMFVGFSTLIFGQTTIATYTFDTDVQGWIPGSTTDTGVLYDATNYFTQAGSLKMEQIVASKVIKVTGINITAVGDYTLKFKIKGNNAATVKGIIRTDVNYAGTALVMNTLSASTGGDGATWYEYSTTLNIPAINSNSQIQIQTNTLGFYYIDDVTLVKEAVAGNTLTVNIVGAGSVTKTLDKIGYDPTDVETLTAIPTTHWYFDSWSGDLTGSTNPMNITMNTNKTVTANFLLESTFGYAFLYNTVGDLEGWTTETSFPVTSHAQGILTFTTTANGWARFSLVDFPIPAANFNKLTVKLKNNSATTDQLGVVVFNGTDTSTVTYTLSTSDTEFKTYEIHLDPTTYLAWTGTVSSLKLRFADADNINTSKPSDVSTIEIDDIAFTYDPTISAEDFSDNTTKLEVYPNPSNGLIYFNTDEVINKVEVYNFYGALVLKTNAVENSVDLSSLNNGIYITRCESINNKTFTSTLVKK